MQAHTPYLSSPVVVVYEAESQLRAIYVRHIEAHRLPVSAAGTERELLDHVTMHKPQVVLYSAHNSNEKLWQTLLAMNAVHPAVHVVLLSSLEAVAPTETLGTNISAHLYKQQSSPKEVARTIINFLTHPYAHV